MKKIVAIITTICFISTACNTQPVQTSQNTQSIDGTDASSNSEAEPLKDNNWKYYEYLDEFGDGTGEYYLANMNLTGKVKGKEATKVNASIIFTPDGFVTFKLYKPSGEEISIKDFGEYKVMDGKNFNKWYNFYGEQLVEVLNTIPYEYETKYDSVSASVNRLYINMLKIYEPKYLQKLSDFDISALMQYEYSVLYKKPNIPFNASFINENNDNIIIGDYNVVSNIDNTECCILDKNNNLWIQLNKTEDFVNALSNNKTIKITFERLTEGPDGLNGKAFVPSVHMHTDTINYDSFDEMCKIFHEKFEKSPEWGEFFIFTMANSFDGVSSQRLDKTTEFIEIDIDCQGFDKEMLIGKP